MMRPSRAGLQNDPAVGSLKRQSRHRNTELSVSDHISSSGRYCTYRNIYLEDLSQSEHLLKARLPRQSSAPDMPRIFHNEIRSQPKATSMQLSITDHVSTSSQYSRRNLLFRDDLARSEHLPQANSTRVLQMEEKGLQSNSQNDPNGKFPEQNQTIATGLFRHIPKSKTKLLRILSVDRRNQGSHLGEISKTSLTKSVEDLSIHGNSLRRFMSPQNNANETWISNRASTSGIFRHLPMPKNVFFRRSTLGGKNELSQSDHVPRTNLCKQSSKDILDESNTYAKMMDSSGTLSVISTSDYEPSKWESETGPNLANEEFPKQWYPPITQKFSKEKTKEQKIIQKQRRKSRRSSSLGPDIGRQSRRSRPSDLKNVEPSHMRPSRSKEEEERNKNRSVGRTKLYGHESKWRTSQTAKKIRPASARALIQTSHASLVKSTVDHDVLKGTAESSSQNGSELDSSEPSPLALRRRKRSARRNSKMGEKDTGDNSRKNRQRRNIPHRKKHLPRQSLTLKDTPSTPQQKVSNSSIGMTESTSPKNIIWKRNGIQQREEPRSKNNADSSRKVRRSKSSRSKEAVKGRITLPELQRKHQTEKSPIFFHKGEEYCRSSIQSLAQVKVPFSTEGDDDARALIKGLHREDDVNAGDSGPKKAFEAQDSITLDATSGFSIGNNSNIHRVGKRNSLPNPRNSRRRLCEMKSGRLKTPRSATGRMRSSESSGLHSKRRSEMLVLLQCAESTNNSLFD